MKLKFYLLTSMVLLALVSHAQDEGNVVIKERFERNKTIYFSLGPAITLGKNLGDYSTGFSFEAGFLKRSNRLLSWGPSLSFLNFAYDQSKTYKYYYDPDNDIALELTQKGGGVSILSAGINVKLSLIPVSDNTVFSVYGIVNPFVSFVSREEVTEHADEYVDNGNGVYDSYIGQVDYKAEDYPSLASDNKFSAGAHIGFGCEFRPAKRFSFFGQATFCYTLPVTYLATESFLKKEDRYVDANDRIYYNAKNSLYLDDFPIVKKGFSSVVIKIGMAFNF